MTCLGDNYENRRILYAPPTTFLTYNLDKADISDCFTVDIHRAGPTERAIHPPPAAELSERTSM